MATIDSLCIIVELEPAMNPADAAFIKRIIRSYEGQGRAEEDLELLALVTPNAQYRIDPIEHIER